MNLAAKYRPKTFKDVVGQSITTEILSGICEDTDNLQIRNFLLTGPAGTGKAQPLYSKVLTPQGFISMQDVYVGIKVFTENGTLASVSGVYPQGNQGVFEILLDDNTAIRVAEDHLNVVYQLNNDTLDRMVVSTKLLEYMYKSIDALYVSTPIIYYDYKKTSCSPYIFGMVIAMKAAAMRVDTCHIPYEYLYNDIELRKDLLQGILDIHSSIIDHSIVFDTTYPELSTEFAELVRSLGIIDVVTTNPSTDGIVKYVHTLQLSSIHEINGIGCMPTKYRKIVDIKYIGAEPCQCLYIDDKSHTYISDGFIPTHNTTIARAMADTLNDGLGEPIEIDAASYTGVDAMRDVIKQSQAYPVGYKWKVFIIDECHALSSNAWQAMLLPLESNPAKSIFIFATTNPEKIPPTILSRVQRFQLSKLTTQEISNRLKYIISCENADIATSKSITYTDSGIDFISRLANGGMRDAITLLEKAITYSLDLTDEHIVTALELPNYDDFFVLLQAFAVKDSATIATVLDRIYNSGMNFNKWMVDFYGFVMNVVKFILLQDIDRTMIPVYYKDRLSKYTQAHAAICLNLANRLRQMNYDLKTTPYLLETALQYLCS